MCNCKIPRGAKRLPNGLIITDWTATVQRVALALISGVRADGKSQGDDFCVYPSKRKPGVYILARVIVIREGNTFEEKLIPTRHFKSAEACAEAYVRRIARSCDRPWQTCVCQPQGKPAGNLRLGRRFTPSERRRIRKGVSVDIIVAFGKPIPTREQMYAELFGG